MKTNHFALLQSSLTYFWHPFTLYLVFVSMAPSKEVIIVGGGISGLGMAVQLKRMLGHDNFTVFEKSDNIGGTWWHNRYPACACDIPSHFYSYSFALKPDWSSMYPGRDELHSCKASELVASVE